MSRILYADDLQIVFDRALGGIASLSADAQRVSVRLRLNAFKTKVGVVHESTLSRQSQIKQITNYKINH